MIESETTWLKGYVLGVLSGGILGVVALASCTSSPAQVVEIAPQVNPKADFAAIKFYDCGALIAIAFIKPDGNAEGVRIQGPAHLDDMNLRISKIPYHAVNYLENQRPCGFAVEEKDIL